MVIDAEAERRVGYVRPGENLGLPEAELTLARGAAEHEEIELAISSSEAATRQLLRDLNVERPGNEASLIQVSYRSSNPRLARDVPNVLMAHYLALGESVQKSEARSMATFLRDQLQSFCRCSSPSRRASSRASGRTRR
jgi:uncharacterized protein involved in exopolysaccharide biosynthesis